MDSILAYERAGVVLLDPIGTFLGFALVLVIGVWVSSTRLAPVIKRLVYAALAMRVLGAVARYVVLFGVYDGSGDARIYYRQGLVYAEALWRLDPGPLFNPANWWSGSWYGTQFVYFPTSAVLALTGASMPAAFIVFSLFAFAGLCGFVLAFRRTYPEIPIWNYARWVWFFPALWYWPASIGKESLILLALGMVVLGYTGKNGKINWFLLALGVFVVFGIRPEVAAVVIFSILVAHWLSLITARWTLRNTLQSIVLIGGGLAGIYFSAQFAGIDALSVDGVQGFMEDSGGREVGGESSFEAAEVGLAGIPLALITILMRPFPWEASNMMVMITCVEILAFWGIVFLRRRNFARSLRYWRHDRLLRIAIPFVLLYSISLGMVIGNMGIIARQRIFIFPFLFLLVEAVPRIALRRTEVTPARRGARVALPGVEESPPPAELPQPRRRHAAMLDSSFRQ